MVNDLSAARGVYLLTCPATGRHYVGSATGVDGFWGRWSEYRRSGHGGNVGLFGVETAPFSVSILQVAGSGDTETDIITLEQIWKNKLASLAFGFNHN